MKLIIDISEEEYKEVLEDTYSGTPFENKIFTVIANGTPYEERTKSEWIPIKTRSLTEEEKEEYPDWSFVYDCQMPEDGQEVLVSTKWGVNIDIYCKCIDGCYFENYCDDDDVLAWMPLPKSYEETDND